MHYPNGSPCWYRTYANISEIKDGKIIRPIKSRIREFDATTLNIVENKLKTYIRVFDGTAKSFNEIEEPFEDLYSSEFIEDVPYGSSLTKQQMRSFVTELLFLGTAAQLVSFVPLDGSRFKAMIHFENDFSTTLVEPTGTIKDGKLASLQTLQPEITPDLSFTGEASSAGVDMLEGQGVT